LLLISGEKYLDCLTSNERFSLPEIELVDLFFHFVSDFFNIKSIDAIVAHSLLITPTLLLLEWSIII